VRDEHALDGQVEEREQQRLQLVAGSDRAAMAEPRLRAQPERRPSPETRAIRSIALRR